MNRNEVAAIVTIIVGVIEIWIWASTGAWLLISWIGELYGVIVSTPYASPILTFIIGLGIGLYIGVGSDPSGTYDSGYPNKIYACLSIDDVVWKARADFSGGSLSQISVEPNPYCPECATVLNSDRETIRSAMNKRNIWECDNCTYKTDRDDGIRSKAENIVERHFRQMATNKDKDYAYGNLVDRIEEDDREVTGESIWAEYVKVAEDDEYLSTECFV